MAVLRRSRVLTRRILLGGTELLDMVRRAIPEAWSQPGAAELLLDPDELTNWAGQALRATWLSFIAVAVVALTVHPTRGFEAWVAAGAAAMALHA